MSFRSGNRIGFARDKKGRGSDPVNLQGRRDDVVEFTRAVGDDSSKCRPNRQADQGLHYGRFQTERFCG
ncbi:hypothetical protein GEV33_001621 [Tenebrio molitor]|uniref:Uncharacterized protein n=1 Tax=Tenebrio molitor TaxID=7067 RepID=A0A8J6HLX8_TENMO|nr:hypothetical protein GEV33_001621 [Tenebrio molitor]